MNWFLSQLNLIQEIVLNRVHGRLGKNSYSYRR
jgi:hypothetical protein